MISLNQSYIMLVTFINKPITNDFAQFKCINVCHDEYGTLIKN